MSYIKIYSNSKRPLSSSGSLTLLIQLWSKLRIAVVSLVESHRHCSSWSLYMICLSGISSSYHWVVLIFISSDYNGVDHHCSSETISCVFNLWFGNEDISNFQKINAALARLLTRLHSCIMWTDRECQHDAWILHHSCTMVTIGQVAFMHYLCGQLNIKSTLNKLIQPVIKYCSMPTGMQHFKG